MRLKDKTADVTGAANGIGRAIAELFAFEGANVILADIESTAGKSVEAAIRTDRGRATFVRCDVASAKAVERLMATALKQNGRIDILCNNAAYFSKQWHDAATASQQEWENSFKVSLLGTQLALRRRCPT